MENIFEFILLLIIAISVHDIMNGVYRDYKSTNGYMKNKNGETVKIYSKSMYEYDISKYEYETECGIVDYEKTTIDNDMYNGCGYILYPNGYLLKSIWKNNTENGYSILLDNNYETIVTGNKKNGKYNGLVKIHMENVVNTNIEKLECIYVEGVTQECFIQYDDNITYVMNEEKMKNLGITKII